MENASKALIMAGSVLLSLLIIGALVFMFDSLKGLKQTEATSEEVQRKRCHKSIFGLYKDI